MMRFMTNQDIQFDVAVIGGGAAGMMAAIRAAEKGARVAIVERNDDFGRKLLMAGGGRCNLTQAEFNDAELVKRYGRNGKFLFSAFAAFGPKRVIGFFEARGLKTKVEKNGRVFPVTDRGRDVLEVLKSILKENNVNLLTESRVDAIECEDGKITKLVLKKGEITAHKYILCTGGKSYPASGSTGQGYAWAEQLGHKVIEPKAVLVPLKTREAWVENVQGVSLTDVDLSVWANGKKMASQNGDMLFAHFGLTGPLVLNLSSRIKELFDQGEVKVKIDLKPHLTLEQLDAVAQKDFEKNAAKRLSNCLVSLVSPKLLELIFELSGVNVKEYASRVNREDRKKIVNLIKGLELNVDELFGFDRAMVTSGGVSIKEIDSKTMRSKLIDNLYFAGEVIDVDGPTGGYNLQMCWSTGYVAGENAAS